MFVLIKHLNTFKKLSNNKSIKNIKLLSFKFYVQINTLVFYLKVLRSVKSFQLFQHCPTNSINESVLNQYLIIDAFM